MAAILRLRRGTSTPTLLESELFFNTTSETLVVGESTGNHTLVKIGENTGDISFSGDITASNMLLTGDLVAKDVTLSGNIYVGDELSDTITVSGQFDSNLLPSASDEFDLGSTSKKWNNLYVVSASIQNLEVGGSGILSSSQQITDYNTFLEINEMDVVSGSSQVDLTQTTNYVSGIKTRLNLETVISGSSQVTISETTGYTTFSSSIASTDVGQNDRLDELESFSASLDDTYEEKSSEIHTLVSGSSQIQINDVTGFTSHSSSVDNRLIKTELTGSDHETRVVNLESTGSDHETRVVNLESTGSDHETRVVNLESFSSSLDDTFVTETELTDATASLSASLTETDVDFENRITEIETTFSSSVDSRLDSQESFSSSIDTTIKTKMNLDNVISGSSQITNGSGILSSSNEDFNTFSSSIDGRVDSLETTFSSSVDSRLDSLEDDSHTHSNKTQLDTINQNLSKTSNVTFNDITSSGNVIIGGDLTVLGNATEIQTSELRIEDKLITIASGSTNSAEADGSGIEIDGAGKSIIWDDATQSFILNAQVSSSVGFKGDGSELTDVTAADVEYLDVLNKPTLVSGSSQISFTGITDKPTLFSGSSQVNADTITNFDSNVKTKLDSDSVVSGSSGEQLTASLDLRYLEINGDNIFSGSSQVNADTITNFDSNVKTKLDLDNVVSSSIQVTISETTGYTTFSSSIASTDEGHDGRLDELELFSASLDDTYEEIASETHTLFSASNQVQIDSVSGFTSHSSSVDSRLNRQEIFSESLDNVYEEKSSETHTLFSGSSQTDVTQTNNYSSIRQYDDSDNTIHLNSLGVVSSSLYSSPSQGTLRVTINGDDPSDVDLGLQSTDIPTFNSLTASNLPQHDNTHYDALFKGTSGEFGYRTLGNAAFYMVSSSISDGNPEVLGNAGAVKDYIDEQLVIIGAGDITGVTAGDGIDGGAESGEAIINLHTGSQHFLDGVKRKLDSDNVHSSSYLGTATTSNLTEGTNLYYTDLRVETKLDTKNVFSSSAQVQIDSVNGFTSFSSSVDSRLDGLEGVTSENPLTFTDTSTIDFTRVGDEITADVIGGVVSGSSGEQLTASLDLRYLEINGDNIFSGSSQIDVTQTTNYSSINQYSDDKVKLKLDADNVISGSDQLTGSLDSQYVTLTGNQTIGGTKTFNDIVVNGTGSFAYIESVEGSAKIIGDAYIVLNNDTPTERYAGIQVYDSGSTNTTASLEFDGQTNDWFYQYTNDGGVTDEFGAVLFGPEYSTKGSPTYPTNNTIQKGNGGHHLLDSNITDDGSTITLGSNTHVNGNITLNGTVDGVDLQVFSSSVDDRLDGLEGVTNVSDFTNDAGYITGYTEVDTLATVTGRGSSTSTTISITNTTQSTTNATGALIVSGGVGIAKTLNVGEDVVAYASSDRRLKENITPISNPLQKINSIGGYSFDWNDEKQHIYKGKDYGVIAQEIEEILPELVDTRESGYKAVKYDKLVSLLIEGIKELSHEVNELKTQINK